jgi:hypothetical protein
VEKCGIAHKGSSGNSSLAIKRAACPLVFLAGLWYTFNGRIELIFKRYNFPGLAFTSVDADRSGDTYITTKMH